jgi:Ca-activated chloride channel family protein
MGEVVAEKIVERVKKANCANLRLFTFGVGEDLNTKLLDILAEENHGVREYVATGEDIEIKVSSFFEKVSSPVLSNIKVQFPSSDKLRITEVYPREFSDLFKGATVTMLGRYQGTGDQAIRLTGLLAGKAQEFVFEVSFPDENKENDMIPRLWANRKVGFLLDQIRLHGEDPELKKEVVALAKRFGIVTPYTSYLVVEDNIQTNQLRREVFQPGDVQAPRSAPSAFAPQEDSERGAMREKAAGMKDESGKRAVEASKEFKSMQEGESLDTVDKKRDSAPGKSKGGRSKGEMRTIGDKTFYLENGAWYDSESRTPEASKLNKVRIKYLSSEYLALLKDEPDMCKFLSLGARLVLVWKNQVYEIYQS